MPARAGFHLSVCAMLPWIKPTLIGVPCVSVFDASRRPPQIDTTTISTIDVAAAITRRRPVEIAATAKPTLSSATNSESPWTPTTLASCAIGRNVTIVLPSGIHGKPPIRMPRRYSIETHAAGASHSPATRKRRTQIAVIAPKIAM